MRVTIHQPALPKYRLPVFAELARRVDLTLVHGRVPGLGNVEADGFDAQEVVAWRRGGLLWNRRQVADAAGGADTLVMSWNARDLSLWPALRRARRGRVGTVLWGHGYSKAERPAMRRLRDALGRRADAVLLYDRRTADRLVGRGFEPERVFVAPNAIDQVPVQAARRHWLDRPEELAAFGDGHDLQGPTLLYVSRVEPANRVDLIVEAVARLEARHSGINAVLIGKITGDDRREIEALARRRGVAGRVRLLGPIYEERTLAAHFLSADVFLYPANIGLSLLHAFGYGLPAVTSDHTAGQNPEIVALRDGDNGLTYRHGDADDLAAKLDGLLRDDARREAMAASAHRTATEEFTLEKMVDGMEAAIRFAAANRR